MSDVNSRRSVEKLRVGSKSKPECSGLRRHEPEAFERCWKRNRRTQDGGSADSPGRTRPVAQAARCNRQTVKKRKQKEETALLDGSAQASSKAMPRRKRARPQLHSEKEKDCQRKNTIYKYPELNALQWLSAKTAKRIGLQLSSTNVRTLHILTQRNDKVLLVVKHLATEGRRRPKLEESSKEELRAKCSAMAKWPKSIQVKCLKQQPSPKSPQPNCRAQQ